MTESSTGDRPGKPGQPNVFSDEFVPVQPGVPHVDQQHVEVTNVYAENGMEEGIEPFEDLENVEYDALLAAIEEGDLQPDALTLSALVEKGRLIHCQNVFDLAQEMASLNTRIQNESQSAKGNTQDVLQHSSGELQKALQLASIFASPLQTSTEMARFCRQLSEWYAQQHSLAVDTANLESSEELPQEEHFSPLPPSLTAIATLEEEDSPDSQRRNEFVLSAAFWKKAADRFAATGDGERN